MKSAQQRIWRERTKDGSKTLVDATETHRKLRALMAAGHTAESLARELGSPNRQTVAGVLNNAKVHRDTHEKVSALYGALEAVLGASETTRCRAAKKSWPVPFAWDPETIADPDGKPDYGHRPARIRATNGEVRRLTTDEKLYEYRYLREMDMSHEFALRELGIDQKTWDKNYANSYK